MTDDQETAPDSDRSIQRHALFATGLMFSLHGSYVGLLAGLFPFVQQKLSESGASLSYALAAIGIGSLLATLLSTRLVQNFGSQRMTLLGGVLMCAFLSFLPYFSVSTAIIITFFLQGVAVGLTDVAMNVQASLIERLLQKNYMTRIHACWSVGGILGGLIAGMLIERLTTVQYALFSAITIASAVLLVTRAFLVDPPSKGWAKVPLPFLPASLFSLAVAALLVYLAGGGIRDWSAIFLQKELGSSLSIAVQIYAAFAAATTAGRLVGDAFRSRFGESLLIFVGGAVGGIALLIGLLIHSVLGMFAAVTLFGVAHANLIPALISLASKADPGHEARNVSGIMATGNIGYSVGPIVIGAVANSVNLAAGLSVIVVASMLVSLIGYTMMRRKLPTVLIP